MPNYHCPVNLLSHLPPSTLSVSRCSRNDESVCVVYAALELIFSVASLCDMLFILIYGSSLACLLHKAAKIHLLALPSLFMPAYLCVTMQEPLNGFSLKSVSTS
jgi:hypothetical protein